MDTQTSGYIDIAHFLWIKIMKHSFAGSFIDDFNFLFKEKGDRQSILFMYIDIIECHALLSAIDFEG